MTSPYCLRPSSGALLSHQSHLKSRAMKTLFPNLKALTINLIFVLAALQSSAGCSDPVACNYGSTDIDNKECSYPGCQDSNACNYNANAGCPASDPCLYDDTCGICGGTGTAGCINFFACNYNALAECDDGSCEFLTCLGCTDPNCVNFDPLASIDDGSCVCPPANNNCHNANGVHCGSQVFGTSLNATDNEGLTGTSCDVSGIVVDGAGVWYVLGGTGDQITLATCGGGTAFDTKIHVYEAQPYCSNLVCIASQDNGCGLSTTLQFNSSFATEYYILISGFGGATGDFQLDVTCTNCSTIPANDDCYSAVSFENG
jgi:hypothetical protein